MDSDELEQGLGVSTSYWANAATEFDTLCDEIDDEGWILDPVQNVELPTNVSSSSTHQDHLEVPMEGLDDDGYLLASWEMDRSGIQSALMANNLVGPRLALQSGEGAALLQQILDSLGITVSVPQFRWDLAWVDHEIRAACDGCQLAKRLRGDNLSPTLRTLKDAGSQIASWTTTTPQEARREQIVLPPKGSRRRRQQADIDINPFDESTERDRLIAVLVELLESSSAPLSSVAGQSSNPAQIIRGSLGDSRVGTLKQYVRSLTAFRDWLLLGTGKGWTERIVHCLEYLHVRIEEPCPPSVPTVFLKALAWFEKVGGWQTQERLSSNGILQKTVDYSMEILGSGLAPVRKSPRPPVALLSALELYVCREDKPIGLRLKAFQMLLKSYGCLRENDVQQLQPSQFKYFGGLLLNRLCRTKTTGPSKRIKELPFALWSDMSITGAEWMTTGMALLMTTGDDKRSFLLPNFSSDLNSPRQGQLSYSKSAALTKRILEDLTVPVWRSGSWALGEKKLMPSCFTSAFTEHGPRAFMPSILADLEVEKTRRDFVGRWSPTGSDDYTRSYRGVIKSLQQLVRQAIRDGDRRLGEDDVAERLQQFGEATGVDNVQFHIAELLKNCHSFSQSMKESNSIDDDEAELLEVDDTDVNHHLSVASQDLESRNLTGRKRLAESRVSKFLIVYSQGRRFARLHRIGSRCPWVSTEVRDCEEVSEAKPAQYNARCKLCFPSIESDTSDSQSS